MRKHFFHLITFFLLTGTMLAGCNPYPTGKTNAGVKAVSKFAYKNVGENVYKPPVSKEVYIDYTKKERGILFFRGDKNKKQIALTFDDGPDRKNTPQVLDVLKKYNVKATFFVVGKQVLRFKKEAQRIVQEGHEIGNHTFTHPALTKDNKDQITQEILLADDAIQKTVGVKTYLFRPPYGIENPEILASINEMGYDVILWTVDTDDWKHPPVTYLINYVLNHKKNGAIILMHSGEGEKLDSTIKALPFIINTLREKGYTFVTVSTLLNEKKKNIP